MGLWSEGVELGEVGDGHGGGRERGSEVGLRSYGGEQGEGGEDGIGLTITYASLMPPCLTCGTTRFMSSPCLR